MLVANARRGSLFTMQVVHWLYARLGFEALKLGGLDMLLCLAYAMQVHWLCLYAISTLTYFAFCAKTTE